MGGDDGSSVVPFGLSVPGASSPEGVRWVDDLIVRRVDGGENCSEESGVENVRFGNPLSDRVLGEICAARELIKASIMEPRTGSIKALRSFTLDVALDIQLGSKGRSERGQSI